MAVEHGKNKLIDGRRCRTERAKVNRTRNLPTVKCIDELLTPIPNRPSVYVEA